MTADHRVSAFGEELLLRLSFSATSAPFHGAGIRLADVAHEVHCPTINALGPHTGHRSASLLGKNAALDGFGAGT
jgi:hypothetical protein